MRDREGAGDMTVVDQLAALDFAAIDDALGRVRTAVDVDGELDLGALDITSLLGDLGPLIESVEQLDTDPDALLAIARSVLDELVGLVGLPEAGELTDLLDGLATLAELIAGVVEVLASGDGRDLADRLLTEVGRTLDLDTLVSEVVGRSADALGVDLPDPLQDALEQLGRLGTDIDDPGALADVVLRSIGGVSLDDVVGVAGGLSGALSLVVGAGDHERVEGVLATIDARVDAIVVLSSPPGTGGLSGDRLDALIEEVESLVATLDALASTELPRLADGIATDLRSARNQLVALDPVTALDDLRAKIPSGASVILDVLVVPLRELAGGLGAVTAESIEAALAEARVELTDFISVGALGDLLDGIEDGQRQLTRVIRDLPLELARDSIVAALRDVQQAILEFRGFDVLDDLVAPVRALIPPLQAFDTSSVTAAVEDLVAMVDGVFADFPIDDLRDAIDAIVEPLGAILDEATPIVEGVVAELEALVAQVDQVDFEAAGAEVLEALAEIRNQVQDALSTDDVPDALKAVIAGAAATLKAMDLAVELSDPFEEALAEIDVGAVLEPIEELWNELGAALERATPAALIAELDPPFEQMLAKLDEVSLAPLTDALSGLFDQLLEAIRRADPRQLVAPLEAEFQQLLATLRGVLDPAPLFAPLRAAYDELQGLLASIDIEAVMDEVLGGIADAPSMVTDAVGSELDRRSEGGGVVPTPGDDAFRFGDILRPFAALVAEIRGRLHALGDQVVGEGLGMVADATRALRALLDPAAGIATRLADALDERRGWLEVSRTGGPLGVAHARLAGLQRSLDALSLDATARARLDTALGPVRLDARIELDVSVTAPALEQAAAVEAAGTPDGMGRSVRLLARALDELLPGPLLEDVLDPRTEVAAFVDALVDPIDPAPVVAELDAIGEEISTTLAGFVDQLSVGLLGIWDDLVAGMQPLMPTSIAARLQAVVTAVADELSALDPGVVEDEARQVVDAAVGLLGLHSPATVAAEFGAVFDAALGIVEDLDPGDLLGDLDPFAGLRAELEVLRPSVVLEPLVTRTASLTDALELIASIDLGIAGELVVELEAAFVVVLDGVEREWEALLDELSGLGGGSGGSVGIGL